MHSGSSPLIEKALDIKQNLSEFGSLAVDAAKEKAGQVKDNVSDLYAQGCAQAKSVQKQTESYIQQEPFKALLIAGAAGFAIGWIVSRSLKK